MGFEYPLAAIMPRFNVGRYLGFMVSAWGLTLAMTNFSNSYAGLGIARFITGALESVVAPTFVVLVARWYRREEQPIRQIAWFCGTPLFAIFGGLIGYAVGNIHNPNVASWRVMFLIFGFVTFVWGIILFFFFPIDPSEARFLTPEERIAASAAVSIPETHTSALQSDCHRLLNKALVLKARGNGTRSERLFWTLRRICFWRSEFAARFQRELYLG